MIVQGTKKKLLVIDGRIHTPWYLRSIELHGEDNGTRVYVQWRRPLELIRLAVRELASRLHADHSRRR